MNPKISSMGFDNKYCQWQICEQLCFDNLEMIVSYALPYLCENFVKNNEDGDTTNYFNLGLKIARFLIDPTKHFW